MDFFSRAEVVMLPERCNAHRQVLDIVVAVKRRNVSSLVASSLFECVTPPQCAC